MTYATNFERDLARLVQLTEQLLKTAEAQLEATEKVAAKSRRRTNKEGNS